MKRQTFTNQFQKDIKNAEKRGKNLTKIKAVMFDIINENTLLAKKNDHSQHSDLF